MTQMELSEAMRLGSMSKPQGFEVLEKHGRTCAIGAALDAVGDWETWPSALFPILCHDAFCPQCQLYAGTSPDVYAVIAHLNDTHKWTRERIAEWVESIERAARVAPVATETAAVAEPVQS